MHARRLGPVDLVPRRRQGRPAGAVAGRRQRRVRRAVRRDRSALATASSRSCPACSAIEPEVRLEDLARRCGARGHPAHLDRIHLHRQQPGRDPAVDRPRRRARPRGHRLLPAALAAHRRLPAQLGLVDDVHVDARGLAPGHRRPRATTRRACSPTRRGAPRPATSGTAPRRRCSRTAGSRRCASSRSSARRTSRGSDARSPTWSPSAAAIRPTCFADFVARQRLPPRRGRRRRRQRRRRRRRPARSPTRPCSISSSDAGAHMQMLCASGDTTLVLTRHVRERGDFTLEQAVYELTGRQAEVFGFTGRGVIAAGQRRRPRRVRARRAALRRRRVRPRPARRRRPAAPARRRLPRHRSSTACRCSSTGS